MVCMSRHLFRSVNRPQPEKLKTLLIGCLTQKTMLWLSNLLYLSFLTCKRTESITVKDIAAHLHQRSRLKQNQWQKLRTSCSPKRRATIKITCNLRNIKEPIAFGKTNETSTVDAHRHHQHSQILWSLTFIVPLLWLWLRLHLNQNQFVWFD